MKENHCTKDNFCKKEENKIRDYSIFCKRCVVKLYFGLYVQENINKVPVKLSTIKIICHNSNELLASDS